MTVQNDTELTSQVCEALGRQWFVIGRGQTVDDYELSGRWLASDTTVEVRD